MALDFITNVRLRHTGVSRPVSRPCMVLEAVKMAKDLSLDASTRSVHDFHVGADAVNTVGNALPSFAHSLHIRDLASP